MLMPDLPVLIGENTPSGSGLTTIALIIALYLVIRALLALLLRRKK